MSMIIPLLVGIAAKIGAPLVRGVLEKSIGRTGAELAGEIIEAIAERAGTTAQNLPELGEDKLGEAIAKTEADMPAILSAWNESQRMALDLQKAEMERGGWFSWSWRPAGMWLILGLWFWAMLVHPLANAAGAALGPPDLAVLMNFTALFLALYMGGHTVKAVVDSWAGRR